ncbi:MAG: alpha/beta hydrolase [Thermoanaerobaculia bacterium]|nr:alpha/beta hydrolase [Thermoanaerobaculia bacterium]
MAGGGQGSREGRLRIRRRRSRSPEQLARLLTVLRSPRRRAGTIEERRRELERFVERMPGEIPVESRMVEAGGVRCEGIGDPDAPLRVLYFHGGGYALGSPRTHRQLTARLARSAGAEVLVPDYRLAPENPFPAAVEDARRVHRWLREKDGSRPLVLGGDSAGGGLALALARQIAGTPGVPRGLFVISPWTDLTHGSPSIDENRDRDPVVDRGDLEWMASLYLQGTPAKEPSASPLHGDLRGLPPTLILVSESEALRDDGVRMARKLVAAGIPTDLEIWSGQPHVWPIYAGIHDDGVRAIREIGAWIRDLASTS